MGQKFSKRRLSNTKQSKIIAPVVVGKSILLNDLDKINAELTKLKEDVKEIKRPPTPATALLDRDKDSM